MKQDVDMPTLQEIFQRSEPDRRLVGRTRINRNALLFFSGQVGVFSCVVRDVTNSGAGLRVERMPIIPINFDLSFDNFKTIRKCRLIWRNADFIGVALN
jgi:hypothetical protein